MDKLAPTRVVTFLILWPQSTDGMNKTSEWT